ncbi:hypothetical protein CajifM_p10, partial (mitochondrion) [Candida jiufengensis]
MATWEFITKVFDYMTGTMSLGMYLTMMINLYLMSLLNVYMMTPSRREGEMTPTCGGHYWFYYYKFMMYYIMYISQNNIIPAVLEYSDMQSAENTSGFSETMGQNSKYIKEYTDDKRFWHWFASVLAGDGHFPHPTTCRGGL